MRAAVDRVLAARAGDSEGVLGLARGAARAAGSEAAVRRAYFAASRAVHPDKNADARATDRPLPLRG
jgi:DnaJ-class molecular chaperone